MDKHLSVKQVAQSLSMTSAGIIVLIHEGVFPGAFRTGDHKRCPWKIPATELDAFVAKRQEAARREINLRRTGQARACQILRDVNSPRKSA